MFEKLKSYNKASSSYKNTASEKLKSMINSNAKSNTLGASSPDGTGAWIGNKNYDYSRAFTSAEKAALDKYQQKLGDVQGDINHLKRAKEQQAKDHEKAQIDNRHQEWRNKLNLREYMASRGLTQSEVAETGSGEWDTVQVDNKKAYQKKSAEISKNYQDNINNLDRQIGSLGNSAQEIQKAIDNINRQPFKDYEAQLKADEATNKTWEQKRAFDQAYNNASVEQKKAAEMEFRQHQNLVEQGYVPIEYKNYVPGVYRALGIGDYANYNLNSYYNFSSLDGKQNYLNNSGIKAASPSMSSLALANSNNNSNNNSQNNNNLNKNLPDSLINTAQDQLKNKYLTDLTQNYNMNNTFKDQEHINKVASLPERARASYNNLSSMKNLVDNMLAGANYNQPIGTRDEWQLIEGFLANLGQNSYAKPDSVSKQRSRLEAILDYVEKQLQKFN